MQRKWLQTKGYISVGLFLVACLLGVVARAETGVKPVEIVQGLSHPWSMVFLPDGEILISERAGQLRRIQQGKLLDKPVSGLPPIQEHGQGGLLGLALHPQFIQNHWLYFAYAGQGKGGFSTHLARGKYQDGALTDVQTLFEATPKSTSGVHFGGRVAFDKQGFLFLTLGERGEGTNAQDLSNDAGSLIRLKDDGSIPADNPFVQTKGARPGIYDYGHRNMQGMAIHPITGQVWTCEHGPQGGDEVNIEKPGANYGWPVITYGEQYGGGPIGEGITAKAGMEQPILYWVPSIAPAGMTFYTGDKYPGWQGNLIVSALKFQLIERIVLNDTKVIKQKRLLKDQIGRIRDVQQGPDGYLYLLTDEDNGGLYKLEPTS